MDVTYDVVSRTAIEQGVSLLRIAISYPVLDATVSGAAHINEFEKRYAETLADGLLQAEQPQRSMALQELLANRGRRSRFPTKYIELTGQVSVEVGRVVWIYWYSSRCGGERVYREGKRIWDVKGILMHRSRREVQ